jgi:glucokinase
MFCIIKTKFVLTEMTMKNQKKYIGVDLGGTNIKCGIVTDEGEILYKTSIPTRADETADLVIDDIITLINKVLDESNTTIDEITSIGIGTPGAVDEQKGSVIYTGNLPFLHTEITPKIAGTFKVPCYIGNDANVAALAEALFGAGRGKKSALVMTLGTGLGGGYVLNGKVQGGSHGVGGELGHMIIEPEGVACTCGNSGCFECYTSATALIRWGREAMEKDPDGLIAKRAEKDPENMSAKIIIDLAKENDAAAVKIFNDYTRYMAYGIVSIINIIDPEVIILGGGVSQAGDFLLDKIRAEVAPRIFCKQAPYADILISQMGNDAGIIGAAMLS